MFFIPWKHELSMLHVISCYIPLCSTLIGLRVSSPTNWGPILYHDTQMAIEWGTRPQFQVVDGPPFNCHEKTSSKHSVIIWKPWHVGGPQFGDIPISGTTPKKGDASGNPTDTKVGRLRLIQRESRKAGYKQENHEPSNVRLPKKTAFCCVKWVWVNTYRYIFSGMNIHLPAILGFTRYQGFDPSPNICKSPHVSIT